MALDESDELRLNVLLAQKPLAIKISESQLSLYALTSRGEARIELHPNTRAEQYLKQVREFLSSSVLGSPGGYPIFLKRWTRMGQARDESLERLLLLGEEEAVTAVIHAPGLNLEIARRAWWILPNADNARIMLSNEEIARSDLGDELSAFLLEFLPFEQEQQAMIDSVRLVLQASAKDSPVRQELWKMASRKSSYYVGFLQALPDDLPETTAVHPEIETILGALEQQEPSAQVLTSVMQKVLSESGQQFLKTVRKSLVRPNNQDVVVSLLNAIGEYFKPLNTENRRYTDLQLWQSDARVLLEERYLAEPGECPARVLAYAESVLALSMVDEMLVAPAFSVSDAIGTVMRKRIKPVTDEIDKHLDQLLYV